MTMNDRKPIKVAVVSNQAIYRRGLTSLILSAPGITLIGEAYNGPDADQLCDLAEPDMVVFDLKNLMDRAQETINQIHQKRPLLKMVLLLESPDSFPIRADCDGRLLYCLSRDISEEELKTALEQIRQDTYIRPAAVSSRQPPRPEEASQAQNQEQPPRQVRNQEVMTRELVMAGRIQADILPEEAPTIPGWDITARLLPARETSGDFYDFIPLTDRKWGIVVADVTDKGMGAALFMALSSTLIRTYANRYPTLPAVAMSAVSERILSDTRGSTFVTAFFGVLEPLSGRFIFTNAGHPPGLLINKAHGKQSFDRLRPTGMALGVSEKAQWKHKIVKLNPGDSLILYTDGITEAQDPQGTFFEEERLLDVLLAHASQRACQIQNALIEEVHRFVGNAPRQDDIAVIVIRREE